MKFISRRILMMCVLSVPTSASADGYGFMTPSGNIYCNGSIEGGIECTIVSRSGPPAIPRPNFCGAFWGHDFQLGNNGRAQVMCGVEPETVDYSDIADYGPSAQFGDITCTSEKTGLTCRNSIGHGFFLSRKTQQVF